MFGHRMKLMEEVVVFDPYFSFRFAYHNDCPLAARSARKKISITLLLPARCVRQVRSIFHRDVRSRGRYDRHG
jgi:hypothetical protein